MEEPRTPTFIQQRVSSSMHPRGVGVDWGVRKGVTAEEPRFTASPAYSTWKMWPSGN